MRPGSLAVRAIEGGHACPQPSGGIPSSFGVVGPSGARGRDIGRTPAVGVQVVNEVCVNMIRKAGFAEEQIRDLVTSYYAKYRVFDIGYNILISASELRESYSLSFSEHDRCQRT